MDLLTSSFMTLLIRGDAKDLGMLTLFTDPFLTVVR